jgi:glycosyltransferase involved in cell wall biosynthesis
MNIEVIVPVRNMADHLHSSIQPLLEESGRGDIVTVVDDASTDATAEVAKSLGANVVTITDSRGPYLARQAAANASTADVLLFVDARCRARKGLFDSHRRMQSEPGVALSCTAVHTESGPTLAARIAARQQPFSLDGKVGVPGRLDFYPTANLGVRRTAFEAVSGFRSMRSGADADICWRIQRDGFGTLAADPEILMDWVPRSTMADLLSQWYRYGKSTAYLEWVHGDQSPSASGGRSVVRERIAAAFVSLGYQAGYRVAKLQRSQRIPPVAYTGD